MNKQSSIAAASSSPVCAATPLRPVEAKSESNLPAWADATELPDWAQGHETLLAAIVAERPETNIYDNCGCQGSEYAGVNAAKLRRIYRDWVGPIISENLTGADYEAMRAEVCRTPDADQLIRKLLA